MKIYEAEIMSILSRHKNGIDACWLACEVLGEQFPVGVNNKEYINVLSDILELAMEGKIQRGNVAEGISIISAVEI